MCEGTCERYRESHVSLPLWYAGTFALILPTYHKGKLTWLYLRFRACAIHVISEKTYAVLIATPSRIGHCHGRNITSYNYSSGITLTA